MSKVKKILILFGLFLIISIIYKGSEVWAATSSMTQSKTVTQGSSVTITGSVNAFAWNMTLTGAGQSKKLVGNSSVASNQSASTSITFTASNVGTYNFTFSGDITDINSNSATAQTHSCTINVVAANTGNNSGNNGGGNNNSGETPVTKKKITSLGITPYKYDFQNYKVGAASGTTYYAKVPNEVSSITIYANGATSGTGAKSLKEGTNKFTVSNSDYTYYIVVTRATLDGDEPANKPDEEPEETENPGIVLESLVLEGFEFDKEFDSNVFEYIVKIDKPITLEELNNLKDKIQAKVNSEEITPKIIAEISEEGVATLTIVIEDDEKEYARYVITFEVEEQEKDEKIAGIVATPLNNSKNFPTRGMFGLTDEQQIYVILACFGITFFIAFAFCIVSYVQHKKLLSYEEDDYYEDDGPGELVYEDDSEFGKMNRYYNEVENDASNPSENDVYLDEQNENSTLDKAIDYERKLFKSRSLRAIRRGGKHF